MERKTYLVIDYFGKAIITCLSLHWSYGIQKQILECMRYEKTVQIAKKEHGSFSFDGLKFGI